MKLECSRKEFAEALGLAGSATSVRTALPILQTILLDGSEGASLRLVGCDGEMWAERKILANVSEPGRVCVPYTTLNQLVSALPDGTIQLEYADTTLYLRVGQSEWKLLALPGNEFPEPPSVAGSAQLRLSMKEIRESVEAVSFAVSDDSARPVLTGVLFRYDGQRLTMVATDTHRLAVKQIDREGIGVPISVVVPEKALRAIKSLPIADPEEVTIEFDESRVGVDSGTAKVVSQLLAGSYPNWERVVPTEHTRLWTVDRTEMIDYVKRAMILARDNANRVRFSGQPESIVITVRSEERGEAKEQVPAIIDNGEIDIAFNGKFVLDALQAMRGDGIRAELTEPARPAVFHSADDESAQFCVIMPMAIS